MPGSRSVPWSSRRSASISDFSPPRISSDVAIGAAEKGARFLAVGVWNTLFGFAAFVVLYRAASSAGLHYLFAAAAAHPIAVTNAYLCYKRFVFRTQGKDLREYLRFSASYAGLFVFNMLALPAVVRVGGLGPIKSQALVTAASAALSYLMHSRFSFAAAKDAKAGIGSHQGFRD